MAALRNLPPRRLPSVSSLRQLIPPSRHSRPRVGPSPSRTSRKGSEIGLALGLAALGCRRDHDARTGALQPKGRLPAEVIQRIVRQNFDRFRVCYEQGLARNPNLEGLLRVRFVIGRDGMVSNAESGGSDIPDSAVVGCVVSAFQSLSFPRPEGGIVTVTYPIRFSPG